MVINDLQDIMLLERYLMEVIELIISYDSLQPMVFEKTEMGLVRIPAKIPIELIELKNNIESKLRDSKIKYYAKYNKLQRQADVSFKSEQ